MHTLHLRRCCQLIAARIEGLGVRQVPGSEYEGIFGEREDEWCVRFEPGVETGGCVVGDESLGV